MADEDLIVRVGLTEKQYLAAIARMEQQSLKAAKGAENAFAKQNRSFVRGTERANRSANTFASGGLRNVSMQLSQVAQQGAVTGNYFQALTIQAADIGLAFGTMGIAIGAAISVLGPFAQNLFNVQEAAEDIDLSGAFARAQTAIEQAREAQDRYSAAIRLTGVAQQEVTSEVLASLRLEASAREALAALEIAQAERQRLALQKRLDAAKEGLQEVIDLELSYIQDQAGDGFARSRADAERLAATQEILAANEEIVLEIRAMQAELDVVNSIIARGGDETTEFMDNLIEAANNAEATGSAIASIDFSSAISGAINLSNQLGISLQKAMQIQGLVGAAAQARRDAARGPILDPRDPNYDPNAARLEQLRQDILDNPATPPRAATVSRARGGRGGRRSSRGGGGISEAARQQAEYAREAQRYIDQTRTALEEYNAELAKLEMLNKNGFFKDAPEAYARAVAQVTEEFQRLQFERVIDGIDSISDAMGSAIVNGENMGEALRGVFRQIASDLVSSGIRQGLMGLLGFGGGFGGGGGLFGGLFAGLFDSGGRIPAGQFGIVGERGPEIVTGPANVTSTADTARMMGAGQRLHVSVGVEDDGKIMAIVRDQAGKVVAQSTPKIVSASVAATREQIASSSAFLAPGV